MRGRWRGAVGVGVVAGVLELRSFMSEHWFEPRAMATKRKTRKKKRAAGRRPPDRTKPIKATVYTHASGLRLIDTGRGLIFDQSQMTEDARDQVRSSMVEYAESLPRLVAEEAKRVRDLIYRLPTLTTLSMLGFFAYGINPDTYVESEHEWVSNEVEWPTRVALSLPKPIDLDPRSPALDAEGFQQLIDTVRSMHAKQKDLIATEFIRRGREAPDPRDIVVMQSRLYKLSVRTLIYPHQRKDWLRRLFTPVEAALKRLVGFSIDDAIWLVERIGIMVNERVRDRLDQGHKNRDKLRAIARERGFESTAEQDEYLRKLLITWLEAFMDVSFTFSPADFESPEIAQAFLDRFSLTFGLPEPRRPGPVPELMQRPIVKVDDGKYLCHIPLLLDAIRPNLESALKASSQDWEAYEDVRSRALEEATTSLWRRAIPAGSVSSGLHYELTNGARGELDVMCQVDRTLILCECKAGAIEVPANQGASLRSQRKILKKAHRQALRARDHIVHGTGAFRSKTGETLAVRPEEFDRVVLSVVTLDDSSAYTTNTAYAVGAGIFESREVPWSVTVSDFEIMADLVDLNVLLPHYLMRRARIAQWEQFTAVEELDWFMHYMNEGLWFSGDLSQLGRINLGSFTQPLDDYYMYVFGPRTKPAPKPSVKIQPQYKQLLRSLEESRPPGWLEAAHILMDVDHGTRQMVIRFMRDLLRKRAAAGRTLFVEDAMIAVYSEPAGLGVLRPSMLRYAKSHMVKRDVSRCAAIGLNPRYSDSAPIFAYIDARRDALPSLIQSEAFLTKFNSTYLSGPG